jgi:hypothetical protein
MPRAGPPVLALLLAAAAQDAYHPPAVQPPDAPTPTPAPTRTPSAPPVGVAPLPGQGFRALTDRWTIERVERVISLLHQGDRDALAGYLAAEVPRVPHATDPPDLLDLKGLRLDRLGYRADLAQVKFDRLNLWSAKFDDVNLRGAHFSGCLLGLATFHQVYLRDAAFKDCDLYGCDFSRTNLQRVKLERTALRFSNWMDCEIDIGTFAAGLHEEHTKKWALARDVYKALRLNLTAAGDDRGAAWATYQESVMNRRDERAKGRRWAWLQSVALDVLWGYGQRPSRLLFFSILFCFLCAAGYFLMGVKSGDTCTTGWNAPSTGMHVFECVYFSFITFTTVGYGDITPCSTPSRILAACEALSGIFTMGLFVTANVRKLEGR